MKPNPSLQTLLAISLLPLSTFAAEKEKAATDPAPEIRLDFGDHTSSTLTTKAWGAYEAKNHGETRAYANKCIEMFRPRALEMQKELGAPATDKEEVFKSWALNDVGTCYFILGQSFEAEDKTGEALAAYKYLVEHLSFAQCWDEKGWFWKPAEAARERVKALEFEALK